MQRRSDGSRLNSPPIRVRESDVTGWQLAKWLIPSVTMLFFVVGYVAVHGHDALLGWDRGLRDPNEYVATAADFVGSAIANLLNFAWYPTAAVNPLGLLVLCTSLVLLTACGGLIAEGKWVPKQLQLRGRLQTHWAAARKHPELALTCGLILLVVLKASVLDVPLARVEGVLVSQIAGIPEVPQGKPSEKGTHQNAGPPGSQPELRTGGSWVFGAVARRSHALYEKVVCSRRYEQDDKPVPGLNCPASHDDAIAAEKSEFTTQVLSGAVVLLLGYLLIQRTRSKLRAGLAWLCVASTLSVPYAFGKLGMSTQRDFSIFALKTRIDQVQDDKTGAMKQLVGVVLARDKDTTAIATLQFVTCGKGTAQLVRFWRISNSEIVWAREIFRTDAIAWKLSQETDTCDGQKPHGNKGNK